MLIGPAWTLCAAFVPALVLAGCADAPPAPADLRMSAQWQPWQDDAFSHLIVTIANVGGQEALVGPGGEDLRFYGPAGSVPVDWGETPFARPVLPAQTVTVAFHPRHVEPEGFALSIDHAAGVGHAPPLGLYTVCLGDLCRGAVL